MRTKQLLSCSLLQDETVISLGIMDLNIEDTSRSEAPVPFVSLTAHRSLVSFLLSEFALALISFR